MSAWTRDKVAEAVLEIVKETTQDFESEFGGDITIDTHLGTDLGFESVDMVEMFVGIEQKFERRDLPVQKLIGEKKQYYDFTVKDIVDFLCQALPAS